MSIWTRERRAPAQAGVVPFGGASPAIAVCPGDLVSVYASGNFEASWSNEPGATKVIFAAATQTVYRLPVPLGVGTLNLFPAPGTLYYALAIEPRS